MTANNEELVQLAQAVIDEIDALVDESDGVCGLHMNGDVAPWGEILTGGRFERLTSVEALREALRSQAGAVPGWRKWQIYVESTPTPDDAKRELGLLVDGVSEFAGHVVMLVDENGKCPAVTGCGPEGLRNAEQIVAAMAAAPPSPAADERVRELEAELSHQYHEWVAIRDSNNPDTGMYGAARTNIARIVETVKDAALAVRKADGPGWSASGSHHAVHKPADTVITCIKCGSPTMHMGNVCFTCSKAEKAEVKSS